MVLVRFYEVEFEILVNLRIIVKVGVRLELVR